jgi:hypothetical protein
MTQRITMFRSEGSYNWLREQDRQAQIAIRFPLNGKIEALSACVEIGSEFDIEVDQDTHPEDVITAIKGYYNKLWVSTDKERVLGLCQAYFDNQTAIDLIWYRQRFESLTERKGRIEEQIRSTQNIIEALEEEIETEKADNGQFGVGA